MRWNTYGAALICLVCFPFSRGALGQSSGHDGSDAPSLFKRDPPSANPGLAPSKAPVGQESSGGRGGSKYEFRLADPSMRIQPFQQSGPPSKPPRPVRRRPISKVRPFTNRLAGSNGLCTPGRYYGIVQEARHVSRAGLLSRQECQTYDWDGARTTEWLEDYWQTRKGEFKKLPGGMVSLLREEFLGDGTSTCKLFTAENCDFNKCRDQLTLAAAAPCDLDPASNVLLSVQNVQSWFMTFIGAINQSIQGLALVKDHLAQTFYRDKRLQDYTQFKQLMTWLNLAVGCIGPGAPAISGIIANIPGLKKASGLPDAFWFLPPHLFANFQVFYLANANNPPSDTPVKTAEVGARIWKQLKDLTNRMEKLHDEMFAGREYEIFAGRESAKMTMKDWIGRGNFLGVAKWDTQQISARMSDVIIAKVIDMFWSELEVFILGGQPCHGESGLGIAPAEGTYCLEGKMYSIYYWKANTIGFDILSEHKWGWVTNPPGMVDSLGKKNSIYERIPWQNVIISSVKAWETAGRRNVYDLALASRRLNETFGDPREGIHHEGTAWEGVFTVPVCDISQARKNGVRFAHQILQPYSKESRPLWCGPMCSGSQEVTNEFFKAANLWGYEPPVRDCGDQRPF